MAGSRTLVIACGALARELLAIVQINGLDDLTIECLPASLHNRPKQIPELVRARIHRARESDIDPGSMSDSRDDDPVEGTTVWGAEGGRYDSIFVAYADCGTGGLLQKVCAEEGVEMLDGAHCYQFFATGPRFAEIQDAEIGSFYLTDFLVRHFDRMVWQGLGIDRHPELLPMYFGNYTRLVYLAQTDDPELLAGAQAAAARLGLTMLVERTDYGELEPAMVQLTVNPPTRTRTPAMTNESDATPDPYETGDHLDQGETRERRATSRRGGKRRSSPTISTISWRDIPAQLSARSNDGDQKVLLHARFQHAIDRAADVAGLTSSHEYVQQWRTASAPLATGDLVAQLDQRCAELEAGYPRERLEALVANGGLEPAAGDGRAADPTRRNDQE